MVERHVDSHVEGSITKSFGKDKGIAPVTVQTLHVGWQLIRRPTAVEHGYLMSVLEKFEGKKMSYISRTANDQDFHTECSSLKVWGFKKGFKIITRRFPT
jgi:hypothetical protein